MNILGAAETVVPLVGIAKKGAKFLVNRSQKKKIQAIKDEKGIDQKGRMKEWKMDFIKKKNKNDQQSKK